LLCKFKPVAARTLAFTLPIDWQLISISFFQPFVEVQDLPLLLPELEAKQLDDLMQHPLIMCMTKLQYVLHLVAKRDFYFQHLFHSGYNHTILLFRI